MCFYDEGDCDWTATVCLEKDRLADRPTRCNECSRKVPLGGKLHEVFQQEHESCQICQDEDSESFIGTNDEADFEPEEWVERMAILANHACSYGETFLYRRCSDCDNLFKAIEAREEEEGCPPYARRPMLTELHYAFSEHESNFEYAEKAVEMFPELLSHPFIERLLEDGE